MPLAGAPRDLHGSRQGAGVPDRGAMKIVRIKVKPNARASALADAGDGTLLAHLKSPPVDGKANAELIELVARHFGCARSRVTIKSGAAARNKVVRIDDA